MEAIESKRFVYEFGEFVLDPEEKTLFVGDTPIHLPAKEFETLLLLVEHNGHALTKEEMMSAIWDEAFVEESNLAKQISRLRKVINANGEEYIETLPKHGYRFKADLRRMIVEPDEPLILEKRTVKRIRLAVENEPEPKLALPATPALRFTKARVTVAVVIALFGITAIWFWMRPSTVAQKLDSIAVLPMKTLSGEEKNKVLAAGLTDALITKLGTLKTIVVRPAASVEQFADSGGDAIEIGRNLNVAAVLEGTVLESEGRLRVNMRLVDAKTGQQVWSDKFDGAFTDIFDLEDRISEKVARTILPTITGDSDGRLTRRYTDSAEAYDAYVKGRYFLAKRNEDGFRRAIEYFNEAAAKDPNYSLAYAGLADCYNLQGVWGIFPPNEVFPKARQMAEKALELDNNSAEALTTLAFVEWVNSWDFPKAENDFRRAIDLNPNYATVHHWYSYFLVSMNRHDEAIAEIKKARDLEGPLTLSVNTDIGEIYSWAGRYDEAETYFKNVLSIEPAYAIGHDVYGINLIKQDRLNDAIAELEKARDIESSPRIQAVLAFAYAKNDQPEKARKIVENLRESAKQRYVSPFSIAIALLGLGETDAALANLERAYDERSDTMAILDVYPLLDSLKSDQRFIGLERRVGYKK
jgi:TolB-like protein/DNA-binding winged helix-turn-helix (wHTH) protein/Tfp pilus assembly protein PilF